MEPRDPRPPPGETAPPAEVQPLAGRSACAAEARRAETALILAMSPRERALLALSLGARYGALAAERRK